MVWPRFFIQGGAGVVAFAWIFSGCGAKEDTNIKGLCSLPNCSSRQIKIISSQNLSKFAIEPLFEKSEASIACNLGYTQSAYLALSESERNKKRQFDEPTPFKFRVVRKADGGGGGGEGASTETSGTLGGIPLAGVKVNVDTSGETGPFDPAKTHPELQAFKISRYTKTGIATSPDNWCSDTCGVVSVDIHLRCPFPGTEQPGYIYITSGAIAYTEEIKVKTEDFLDEEGGGGNSLRALSKRPGLSGWASDLSHFLSRRYWRQP